MKVELEQLHILEVFIFNALNGKKLSQTKKSEAISSLMFLMENWDGTINAHACADGKKQQDESIFITAAIEAKEERDMSVMDLPGAVLCAANEDDVIMTITGKLAELVVMIAPQIYQKYIITKKG